MKANEQLIAIERELFTNDDYSAEDYKALLRELLAQGETLVDYREPRS